MQPPKTLNNVALFGLGEAGTLIAMDLQKVGISVTAYDPKDVPTPGGVSRVHTPHEAVASADVIIGLTAGDDALKAIGGDRDDPATALYADYQPATAKLAMAELAKDHGFDFVDVALMTQCSRSLRTPVTVSGSVQRFEQFFALEMPITRLGKCRRSSYEKITGSVMMKGLAAVIIESMYTGELPIAVNGCGRILSMKSLNP